MKITENIRKALREHMSEHSLSTYDVGESLHVSAMTVSRILAGTTQRLNENTWLRLGPMLKSRLSRMEGLQLSEPHSEYQTTPPQTRFTAILQAGERDWRPKYVHQYEDGTTDEVDLAPAMPLDEALMIAYRAMENDDTLVVLVVHRSGLRITVNRPPRPAAVAATTPEQPKEIC